MRFRLTFLAVAAFFVTMNVLLLRSEFGGRNRFGATVPPKIVWEKVLTSPDNSFLEIRHHGVKVGRGNWVASIGESFANQHGADPELPPEGMIKHVTGYRLDFDGNLTIEDFPRVRFYFSLRLDTNQHWTQLELRMHMKPLVWEIGAEAETQQIRIITEDESGRQETTHTFAELRQPEKVLRRLGGPALSGWLALLGVTPQLAASGTSEQKFAFDLPWIARLDRLAIGHSSIRVYRLEARLFDRYKAALLISPVGEILRVELPDDILLTNEGVGGF